MSGVRQHILLQGAGIALCLFVSTAALSINDYVTPCKTKDPELNECVRRAAQDVIQRAAQEIPEIGIPALDPARVSKLELARDGPLTMTLVFSNSTHFGLGDLKVESARVDPQKNVYNFTVLIPRYVVSGDYDVNGRVILLPITGHGQANITFIDVESDWSFSGQTEKKNNKTHLKLTNLVTRIHHNSPKNIKIHFDGLFRGNKALGETMNEFMNSNWKEIAKQLKPSVQTAFDRRLLPLAQRFVSNFPLNELFSDL